MTPQELESQLANFYSSENLYHRFTLPKMLIAMITLSLPSRCLECPFARHLERDRFACGNSLIKVVKSHFEAIAQCRDAVTEACASSQDNPPDKFVQPSPLPDFQGLDLEWIANHIQLTLNWLDVYPEYTIYDGENLIEVSIKDLLIGYIKKSEHQYYSDRLFDVKSLNPYSIALQMVNLNYLDGVVDEVIANHTLNPDYM